MKRRKLFWFIYGINRYNKKRLFAVGFRFPFFRKAYVLHLRRHKRKLLIPLTMHFNESRLILSVGVAVGTMDVEQYKTDLLAAMNSVAKIKGLHQSAKFEVLIVPDDKH